MFKNDYQGGPYFEIFSVQGNQPLSKLKVSGPESSVRTKFDKDLRTFILNLEGESTTSKIALPKTSRQTLHLTHQYLVFQIFIFPGKSFSLEVSLTDKSNLKQRIILSSSHREVVISSLHVKMPCAIIETNVWLNLCLDIDGLMKSLIDGWRMQTIDSTVVSANCKLKRIFTLKTNPEDDLGIPENMLLRGENTATQVLDMDAFIDAGINVRSGTGTTASKRHPSYKSPSSRKKESYVSSRFHRNSEGFVPKLRRSDSYNRSESLSSDERDSFDHGKDRRNDISCCGTAIAVPKLPKISQDDETRPRIVKSAEYSKSRVKHDLIQASKTMSKSADTRDTRRLSDISHASTFVKKRLHDMQTLVRPVSKLIKIRSKSTFELEKIDTNLEKKPLFKSQSLQVLPSIKKRSELTKIDKTNSSMENIVSNPVVNLIAPDHEDRCRETDSLVLGDDKMVDDYLQEQVSNGEEESISVSSSGCATSSGSDLFLYTSSPHSVSQQLDAVDQVSDNDNVSKSTKEHAIQRHEDHTVPKYIISDEPYSLPSSRIDTNYDLELEQNDSDYGTENYPEVSSSPDVNVNCNEDEDYFDDSLNGEFIPVIKRKQIYNEQVESVSQEDDISVVNEIQLSKSPNTKHLDTVHCVKNSYTVRESTESDTMSWLNNSMDQSLCITDRRAITNKASKSKCSPQTILQKRIEETLGSLMNQSVENVDDRFSDSSDDGLTKNELPQKIKNYRYQDEMKSINCTLDLSATFPATPPVGDQLRCHKDENNNSSGPHGKLRYSDREELLNLLFDPVLNCYYDPRTHKYYELS